MYVQWATTRYDFIWDSKGQGENYTCQSEEKVDWQVHSLDKFRKPSRFSVFIKAFIFWENISIVKVTSGLGVPRFNKSKNILFKAVWKKTNPWFPTIKKSISRRDNKSLCLKTKCTFSKVSGNLLCRKREKSLPHILGTKIKL